MPDVRIGTEAGDRVIVRVLGYQDPAATDAWDGNWLRCEIELRAGAFGGTFPALMRVGDFASFRDEIDALYDRLSGHARFATLEGWLAIDLAGDGKGGVQVEGAAVDDPGAGNRLAFAFALDQTFLPPIARQLRAITDAFPARGDA